MSENFFEHMHELRWIVADPMSTELGMKCRCEHHDFGGMAKLQQISQGRTVPTQASHPHPCCSSTALKRT